MDSKDSHYKLLALWTESVGLRGYKKRNWQFLDKMMNEAIKCRDNEDVQKFVLYPAEQYLQAHKDGTLNRS